MQRLGIIIAFSIIATAMVFMAVISIQNTDLIELQLELKIWSVQLVNLRSAQISLGVLLAFSFSLGLILGAIIPFVKPLQQLFTVGRN